MPTPRRYQMSTPGIWTGGNLCFHCTQISRWHIYWKRLPLPQETQVTFGLCCLESSGNLEDLFLIKVTDDFKIYQAYGIRASSITEVRFEYLRLVFIIWLQFL